MPVGSSDLYRDKVWSCPYCNAINDDMSNNCRTCGKVRPSKMAKNITVVQDNSSVRNRQTQPASRMEPGDRESFGSPSAQNRYSAGSNRGYREYDSASNTARGTTLPSAKLSNLLTMLSRFDPSTLKKGMFKISRDGAMVRPGFSSSWVLTTPPEGAIRRTSYFVGDSEVTIYTTPDSIETYYYVNLPEYSMPVEHIKLLQLVRTELPNHYPKNVNLESLAETRAYVSKIGEKLIYSIAQREGIRIGATRDEEMKTVKSLSVVLVKYVAGLGVIEVLLRDPIVQDVYIDAPSSQNRVHIKIGSPDPSIHDKCITNITVGDGDAEALLSRFRMLSGRPFSEAMPVLETDLDEFNSRITVIGRPLSPEGIAMALRRHSSDPWTLLKLIQLNSLVPIASGLLSFLIDGRATILVGGPRGAGKSSMVGAIMLEFPQNQRILTIEDTLELPVPQMPELGYKIQSLWVQSAIGGAGQMTANDALLVSLRLGESAIVLGEVRGQEAKTLYESMRAGTVGSSLLGTIHGNSARSIYERVVHDIGIPPISFMATDIVVIAGLANPGGTQIQKRRVLEISEVDKKKEPGNFNVLMQYDESIDSLVATDTFLNNSGKISEIANKWGMSYGEAIQNIGVRASIRSYMVDYAVTNNKPTLLGADWVIAANNTFWNLLEKSQLKGGVIKYPEVLDEWKKWFNRSVRYA
jgi:type IV secretory pathway ATPase VirB11/archaellum biosynthesis ATPase